MKNLLNAVSITKTLRVKASSEIEAVQIALNIKELIVRHVSGEESVFVGFELEARDTQFVDVVYVEKAAGGYRVEIGSVYVTRLELTFLLDQEEEVTVYCSKDSKEVFNVEEMAHYLNNWFDHDVKSGDKGRMFNHVIEGFTKNTFKNGEFTEVSE